MKHLMTLMMLVWFFAIPLSFAKERNTEHTFKLAAGDSSPPATIESASWLAGAWTGTAFGSQIEEVWNPPSANSMVGMFKVFDTEKGVSFYELMLIVEEKGSIALKVKHFSADFEGWESKDDYVNFPLVSVEENALHFEGLSFYRESDNRITAYVAISQNDGSVTEEQLLYQK